MKLPGCFCIAAKSSLITLLSLMACFAVPAQTFTYVFENAVNKYNAGNAGLAVGSVWLYPKIDAGATTDAVVTIPASTGGISLFEFDQDNTTNGGYVEAFQPGINVPSGTTVNGYVEFTFNFITTGTYNSTTRTGTALLQTNTIPATVLDDDGTTTGGTLYEYDELNLGSGEVPDYSTTGGQLTYSTSGSFIIGSNATGTNYPGITSTATAVMFSVLNQNISSMVYRTGVKSDFTTTPAGRVTSLVFFLPTYPSSVLAVSPFSGFGGTEKDNGISLQWQLTNEESWTALSLERSVNGAGFQSIKDYLPGNTGGIVPSYNYTDPVQATSTDMAYRIKMVMAVGQELYSDILDFKVAGVNQGVFRIYPTLITGPATLSLSSGITGTGSLRIADYTGRIVYRQTIPFNKGVNNITISRPPGLPPGNYVAIVQTNEREYVQKILLGTP